MREIKFRVWDKFNKNMCNTLEIDFNKKSVTVMFRNVLANKFEFDEVELMQYTGLKDKNGKEIYEGDLLPALYGPQLVQWNEDSACWDGVRENGYDTPSSWCSQREVIGNIHENPSLLEAN